jgi:septum formation inhibitor MinC
MGVDMEKIKLNISGNLVGIIIPSDMDFSQLKEQLRELIIKNYKLLNMVKAYNIVCEGLSEEEIIELEEVITSITGLVSMSSSNFKGGEKSLPKFKIHYGNLISGERINAETNLIILGNVDKGSYVKSKKNIFVVGDASGILHIENGYPNNYFIYMEKGNNPSIKIGTDTLDYLGEYESNLMFKIEKGEIISKKISKKAVENLLEILGVELV